MPRHYSLLLRNVGDTQLDVIAVLMKIDMIISLQ